jgi:hypothetical protein
MASWVESRSPPAPASHPKQHEVRCSSPAPAGEGGGGPLRRPPRLAAVLKRPSSCPSPRAACERPSYEAWVDQRARGAIWQAVARRPRVGQSQSTPASTERANRARHPLGRVFPAGRTPSRVTSSPSVERVLGVVDLDLIGVAMVLPRVLAAIGPGRFTSAGSVPIRRPARGRPTSPSTCRRSSRGQRGIGRLVADAAGRKASTCRSPCLASVPGAGCLVEHMFGG